LIYNAMGMPISKVSSTITASDNCIYTYATPNTAWQIWAEQSVKGTQQTYTPQTQTYTPQAYTIHYTSSQVDYIYQRWVQNMVGAIYCNVEPVESAEEIRARQRKEALVRERIERARVIRDEANHRAEKLLMQFLNDRQREQFTRERFFEVASADGNRRYRIKEGWAGNVEVISPEGVIIETLCIHPTKEMPSADNLLAQKLMIETNEELFRKTANITRIPARRAA